MEALAHVPPVEELANVVVPNLQKVVVPVMADNTGNALTVIALVEVTVPPQPLVIV